MLCPSWLEAFNLQNDTHCSRFPIFCRNSFISGHSCWHDIRFLTSAKHFHTQSVYLENLHSSPRPAGIPVGHGTLYLMMSSTFLSVYAHQFLSHPKPMLITHWVGRGGGRGHADSLVCWAQKVERRCALWPCGCLLSYSPWPVLYLTS